MISWEEAQRKIMVIYTFGIIVAKRLYFVKILLTSRDMKRASPTQS